MTINFRRGYLRIAFLLMLPWTIFFAFQTYPSFASAWQLQRAASEANEAAEPIRKKDFWSERTGTESKKLTELDEEVEFAKFLRNQQLRDAAWRLLTFLVLPIFLFGIIPWIAAGFSGQKRNEKSL